MGRYLNGIPWDRHINTMKSEKATVMPLITRKYVKYVGFRNQCHKRYIRIHTNKIQTKDTERLGNLTEIVRKQAKSFI